MHPPPGKAARPTARRRAIRAVVFDMDGVLVDARAWHYEALSEALALFGHAIDPQDHAARFDGLPTRVKLAMLTAERRLPAGLHPFINELKQRCTQRRFAANVAPIPAHLHAIARLRAEGLRTGLASNSIRPTVELVLARGGLAGCFDVVLSADDVARPKPDPEIYREAAARLGLPPHACLVLEDNPNGIRAARAAGAVVLEVTGVDQVCYAAIRTAIDTAEAAQP